MFWRRVFVGAALFRELGVSAQTNPARPGRYNVALVS